MKYTRLSYYKSKSMLYGCIAGMIFVLCFGIWWLVTEPGLLPVLLMIVLEALFAGNILMYVWAERTGIEVTDEEVIFHYLFQQNKRIHKNELTSYGYTFEAGPKAPKLKSTGSRQLMNERRKNTYYEPYRYVKEMLFYQNKALLLKWDMREQEGRAEIEKQLKEWGVLPEQN